MFGWQNVKYIWRFDKFTWLNIGVSFEVFTVPRHSRAGGNPGMRFVRPPLDSRLRGNDGWQRFKASRGVDLRRLNAQRRSIPPLAGVNENAWNSVSSVGVVLDTRPPRPQNGPQDS
jgi:hypothetical protein